MDVRVSVGHEAEPFEIFVDRDVVLTIGVFDGVHLGHQHLIGQVVSRAKELGCLSGAMTFDKHPQAVLRGQVGPIYLTTVAEKMALLQNQGLDIRLLLHFDRQVADLTARQFISRLCQRVKLRELWVGPDFALGRRREGTVALLQNIGGEQGFTVHTVPPMQVDGQVVSSSLIRQKLMAGDVRAAARLLGRFPRLTGEVVEGARRGRTIGFPTANVDVPRDIVLPADGVYAVCAHLGDRTYEGVTNIGVRPSFDNGQRTIEAHLLDFDVDIYGQVLSLEFIDRLRGETRFDSVEGLVCQIKRDVAQAQEVLRAAPCR
ncbi:MAG: bifunctional riboflavin kinase/FAD synthetase [Chloroflexota bacterium]